MKLILSILSFSLVFVTSAQTNVKVSGSIFDLNIDSVHISHYKKGNKSFNNFISAPFNKDGSFELKGTLPLDDYYMLRLGKKTLTLILRNNSDIQIYGDGKNLDNFLNIVNSEESKNLYDFGKEVQSWKIKSDQAKIEYDNVKTEEARKEIENRMILESKRFKSLQRGFIARNPNSPALYAALTSVDPNEEFAIYEDVVKQLNASFGQSETVKKIYRNYIALKNQKDSQKRVAIGKQAPDFEEKMIDTTKSMKLSDLKGQVVLLDFWASWCGPCRRENPNVVRLYEKYKSDGFTVMSVSLDQDRNKWIKAIEKDNLTWPNHVSDLKGWSAAAGRLYGVRGIPFTVLIDREGNILAINLRGAELEKKLAEIFG